MLDRLLLVIFLITCAFACVESGTQVNLLFLKSPETPVQVINPAFSNLLRFDFSLPLISFQTLGVEYECSVSGQLLFGGAGATLDSLKYQQSPDMNISSYPLFSTLTGAVSLDSSPDPTISWEFSFTVPPQAIQKAVADNLSDFQFSISVNKASIYMLTPLSNRPAIKFRSFAINNSSPRQIYPFL